MRRADTVDISASDEKNPLKSQIIGAVLGAAGMLALLLSEHLRVPEGAREGGIVIQIALSVFGAMYGFFIGWLIAIIDSYTASIRRLVKDIQNLKEKAKDDVDDAKKLSIDGMRTSAFYHEFSKHKSHRDLIIDLIKRSAIDNIRFIPNMSQGAFYNLLVKALDGSKKWNAIHQGSIRLLSKNHSDLSAPDRALARVYFKALEDRSEVKKRRIVILNRDNKNEICDPELVKDFFETTGKFVETYWMTEDVLPFFGWTKDTVLHDIALHDDNLLLQHNRETGTAMFASAEEPMTKMAIEIFKKLDEMLAAPSENDYIRLITPPVTGRAGCSPGGSDQPEVAATPPPHTA